MSKRAIRRYDEALRAQKNLKENEKEDSDTDSLEPSPISAKTGPSLFSLLGNSDNDTDEEEDSSKGEKLPEKEGELASAGPPELKNGEVESKHVSQERSQTYEQEPTETPKKSKKKRKKRSKQKRKDEGAAVHGDLDWAALNREVDEISSSSQRTSGYIPESFFSDEDDEMVRREARDIMTAVERMAVSDRGGTLKQGCEGEQNARPLRVETKFLNTAAELKKLFGSRAVEAEQRNERGSDGQSNRHRKPPPPRAHLRRQLTLVKPRDSWVGYVPGLTMVMDSEAMEKDTSGLRYYRYRYEPSYKSLQDEYRVAVENFEPNPLANFVSMHPFHVDGLLQLAEIHRQMGEMEQAAEQIERCIYVLQTSWDVTFKPYDGKCRLRFDVVENRSLYVALFRYSQLLTRRGLHRTALEISKLILNLDPTGDPMGILLLSDSYALLSGEYGWVKSMVKNYEYVPLKYFPNFAASIAIAIEGQRLGLGDIASRPMSRKGKSAAKRKISEEDNLKAQVEAENILIDALLAYPMLLKPIVLAIRDDPGVWAEFALYEENCYSAGIRNCDVLLRICRIYAERSKLLWNSESHKALLARCARKAGELDREAGIGTDPDTGRKTSAFVKDSSKHARVAKCRALRKDAAEWLERSGLYRTLQIGDFMDRSNLPGELLGNNVEAQVIGAQPQREITMTHGAMEFLQSLLPWREAGDAQQGGT
ncbi:Transcription factor 25 [Gracilariopsis chorda]|uniref:Transcription factor 25 n=1 Tax=Gracilariopsis chorda TaxID=448386 RepID=A0A2V3IW89_9FLOR|nr:Transcription factor 25 [Gracilariopsis chorda]|eukprot:PXF46355.1 Transcription factor 25 [Gracilariopsis chorda]